MKLFFKKLALFCLPVILLIAAIEIYLRIRPSEFAAKKIQLESLSDSLAVLVTGSSHAMHGILPDKLSLKTCNISYGSQALYFDRRITEKYLDNLPRLKYVVIPFDYFTLYAEHIANRDFFYKYYYDIDFKDRKFCKEYLLQSFFVYSQPQTLRLIKEDIMKTEQHEASQKWNGAATSNREEVMSYTLNKWKADVFNRDVENNKKTNVRDSVLKDLEGFIEDLQARHVTPVLISYPTYSLLRSFYYPDVLESNKQTVEYLQKKYGILYLDCGEDDSFTVDDYFDQDHLNYTGAAKLTAKLDSVILSNENTKIETRK